jgi:hypothetical protein
MFFPHKQAPSQSTKHPFVQVGERWMHHQCCLAVSACHVHMSTARYGDECQAAPGKTQPCSSPSNVLIDITVMRPLFPQPDQNYPHCTLAGMMGSNINKGPTQAPRIVSGEFLSPSGQSRSRVRNGCRCRCHDSQAYPHGTSPRFRLFTTLATNERAGKCRAAELSSSMSCRLGEGIATPTGALCHGECD